MSSSLIDRILLAIGFLALAATAGWLLSTKSPDTAEAFELMREVEVSEPPVASIALILQLSDCRQLLGGLARLSEHHADGDLAVQGFVVDAHSDADIDEALGGSPLSFPLHPAIGTDIVDAVTKIGYGRTPLLLVFDNGGRLRAASPWSQVQLLGAGRDPIQTALDLTLELRSNMPRER